MLDLGRKCGNMVGEALLVSNESVHPAEPGQVRTLAYGNRQTAENHGRDQPQCFQANGFSSGIASGNDQRPVAGPQNNIQRAHFSFFSAITVCPGQSQKRVAGFQQAYAFVRRGQGQALAVKGGGQTALGGKYVHLAQQFLGGQH